MARFSEVKIFRLKAALLAAIFSYRRMKELRLTYSEPADSLTHMQSNAKRSTHLHSYIVNSHSEL
jgi:hypothetical protein